jgi:ABC-type sugar transport system substrate-binding protein
VAVVTLVSDLPNSRRDFFIGINSVAAGRSAGRLMAGSCGARGISLSSPIRCARGTAWSCVWASTR